MSRGTELERLRRFAERHPSLAVLVGSLVIAVGVMLYWYQMEIIDTRSIEFLYMKF